MRIKQKKRKMQIRNIFINYLLQTWKNKMCALALIGIGFSIAIIDNDATFLIFALFVGIPLFLTTTNYILD